MKNKAWYYYIMRYHNKNSSNAGILQSLINFIHTVENQITVIKIESHLLQLHFHFISCLKFIVELCKYQQTCALFYTQRCTQNSPFDHQISRIIPFPETKFNHTTDQIQCPVQKILWFFQFIFTFTQWLDSPFPSRRWNQSSEKWVQFLQLVDG